MAIDERRRHDLHTWAHSAMGPERAETLMASLPPAGAGALVTSDDLSRALTTHRAETSIEFANVQTEFANVRTEMHTEFANVRKEMHTEFANVRKEMHTGFAKVETEFAEVRKEMHTGFAKVETGFAELRTEIQAMGRRVTVTCFTATVSLWVGTIAVVVAVR